MKMKLLFVCLGNICRSPAAEGIMQKLLKEAGLENRVETDSAGLKRFHEGELPDQRLRTHAALRGYTLDSRSRPMTSNDYYDFDRIICMDDRIADTLYYQAPEEELRKKIQLMTDYSLDSRGYDHVPDPYYQGEDGFELVLDILEDACRGLLAEVKEHYPGQ